MVPLPDVALLFTIESVPLAVEPSSAPSPLGQLVLLPKLSPETVNEVSPTGTEPVVVAVKVTVAE
jgi:hypothetical protein